MSSFVRVASTAAFLIALALPPFTVAIAQDPAAYSRYQEQKRDANENTVSIIGSQAATPYTRFTEDMQNVLDNPEAGGLRVLPMLGRGGGQNFLDLLFLRGVDMGIVEQDVIVYFKSRDPVLFANAEKRVHYIAKLADSELHLFVPANVNKLADLRGKKVNFFKQVSSSAIAAETLFNTCGIKVEPTYFDTDLSVEKFKSGEIQGLVRVSGAPHPAFDKVKGEHGKFLPLDQSTLPPGCYEKLLGIYLPAVLKHEHYPSVIAKDTPVPTLANATLLAVYSWPENTDRYQKIARFVRALFDNIDKLRDGPRHPKWKEINLAAEVPGWTRFKPAQEWIDNNRGAGPQQNPELRVAFENFLKEYVKASGARELTAAQKDTLYTQFVKWWQTQRPSGQAAR